jgi:molybdate transport system substrate-binding protein
MGRSGRGSGPAVAVAAVLAGAVLAGAVLAAAVLAGCGTSSGSGGGPSGGGGSSGGGGPTGAGALSGTVTVFAAASLTGSFTTLGHRFEAAHPGVSVKFNFAASSALATSIAQGAPADVFASASTRNMDSVVRGGDAAGPRTFARNVLEIAVPPDNPGRVAGLADLAAPGLKVALCQPQVPCGTLAQQVLDNAHVTVRPVTLGADVKAVLTAVQTGEVDAGMVYRTDVRAAGAKVHGIEIPAGQNASTSYPIAALAAAPNKAAAQAFVEYVLSADGMAVLAAAGFASP